MRVKFNETKYEVQEKVGLELMGFIIGRNCLDAQPDNTHIVGSIKTEDGDCYAVLKVNSKFKYYMLWFLGVCMGTLLGMACLFGYYKLFMTGPDLQATFSNEMEYSNGKVDANIHNNGDIFKVYLNVNGKKSETVEVTRRDSIKFLKIELKPGKIYEGKLVFKFEDNTKVTKDVSIDAILEPEGVKQ